MASPPASRLSKCRYWNNSILFDMGNFHYNDTFARLALGGAAPPKEFTFIYFVGYGCLPPDHVAKHLRQMNETGDAVVLNLGPHCLSRIGFAEWRHSMDQIAAEVATMRSRVVWRTSFPMREDAMRTALPDTSTFSSHLFFPVSSTAWNEAPGSYRVSLQPRSTAAPVGCILCKPTAWLGRAAACPAVQCPAGQWPGCCLIRHTIRPCLQTEARRQLFDSYAEYAMRKAGVPVWDITAYGMVGMYRNRDMQHMDGQSTRTMNLDMALNIFC